MYNQLEAKRQESGNLEDGQLKAKFKKVSNPREVALA